MSIGRVRRGLRHPLEAYPVLSVLDERATVFALRRSGRMSSDVADRQLATLEARERQALDGLRALLAGYPVTQARVAKSARVDRTMVNKVWNSGLPGRDRQWTRSARIIAATYRALEAEGWRATVLAKTA